MESAVEMASFSWVSGIFVLLGLVGFILGIVSIVKINRLEKRWENASPAVLSEGSSVTALTQSSTQEARGVAVQSMAPVARLKTNRGMLKYVLLSPITLGIYGLVVMSSVSSDINVIASRYDGKKTMHFCLLVFIFSWLTLGIGVLVWHHRLCARIGRELARRGIAYSFGAGSFWGWEIFGALIVVGPFIYLHKLFKAMNLLAKDYNVNG